jgi:hypothetical protein
VLFFTRSYRDLKTKIKLRISFEQVKVSASFQVLAEILSSAFGGSESKTEAGPSKTTDNHTAFYPKNRAEARAMLGRVLNGR